MVFVLPVLGLLAPAARAQDDPVLEQARRKIPEHRKGSLVVKVLGAGGQPAPGAQVEVEMVRHQFLFGCNLFMWGRFGNESDEEAYRKRFADLFNFATLPFYWGGYERRRGEPLHESREAMARWCRERGIVTKGHPLVWNHPASVPPWLPVDPGEVRRLSAERVTDCVTRFRGLNGIWDVVNEATDPFRFGDRDGRKNMMTEALRSAGVVEMVLESFARARAANPGATLLINDYRTDSKYFQLIERLQRDGKPVYDVIGIQSHMHGGVWSSRRAWDVCEMYSRFKVPIHFTETTIVSGPRLGGGRSGWGPTEPGLEEKQAREAARFYTVLFGHPAVEAITWWDFADRGAWQGAAAGFLRRDLSPKPIYTALKKLIREEWWTRARVETDGTGTARLSAFFGDYRIVARSGEKQGEKTFLHDRKRGQTEVTVILK